MTDHIADGGKMVSNTSGSHVKAMTDERINALAVEHNIYSVRRRDHSVIAFARALLAQPAAVEPAKPIYQVSTSVNKKHWFDCCHATYALQPEGCRRIVFAEPSAAVAEHARKAIDAQGAEVKQGFWQSMDPAVRDFIGQGEKYINSLFNDSRDEIKLSATGGWMQSAITMLKQAHQEKLEASPLPAATLGKAEQLDLIAQGRSEVVAMLLELDPEDALDDCMYAEPNADAGDYTTRWDEKKLHAKLKADDRTYSMLWDARGEYYHNVALRDEAEKTIAALAQQPVASDVRDEVANSLMWMYRRLINNYGRLPFVEKSIVDMGGKLFHDTDLQSTPAVQEKEKP